MVQKIEREWRSILCPGKQDRTLIMVEWNIVSEKGRILERNLRQIDCYHPQLLNLEERIAGGDAKG